MSVCAFAGVFFISDQLNEWSYIFKEAFCGVMLPDLSDTRINVAQIGFCWQLTGPAVARLLRILINSFWGGGGEGV